IVVVILKHRVVFPPKAVVNRETRSDFPVVLAVEGVVSPIRVSIRKDDLRDAHAARNSEQERRKRVSDHWTSDGVGEVIASEPPGTENGSVERSEVPEVTAHFHGVLAVHPRQVVQELKG